MDMTTFNDCVIKSHPTGSRYICNPAPTDTDNDTVFLVNGYHDYATILKENGWETCGEEYEQSDKFQAFRKGEENYIVTESPLFYLSYLKATEAAKALNLLKKEDRILLFQTIQRTGMDGLKNDDVFDVGLEALIEFNAI